MGKTTGIFMKTVVYTLTGIQLENSNYRAAIEECSRIEKHPLGRILNDDLIARARKGRVIGLDPQNLKASVLYIVSLDWRLHGLPGGGGSGLVSDCHADAGSQ